MNAKQQGTSTVTKLKTRALTLFMALVSYVGFANTDPNLTGTALVGTGVPAGNPVASPFAVGEAVSFTLNAGNAGDTDMEFPPTGTFQVNVTVQNMGTPVIELIGGTDFFDPPIITSLGQGRFFITFVQNKAIPAGQSGTFKISGVATQDRASAGVYRVTYQANGNPGSYPNTGSDNPSSTGVIDATLPVTLARFNAAREGKTSQLTWTTTEEVNSDRFEVEHSVNGKIWNRIGLVASKGESMVTNHYSFADNNPVNGVNLYRLKMVDKDLTFSYSKIESLKFEGMDADLSVYPNPASEVLRLRDFNQVSKVTVTDVKGRQVLVSGQPADGALNIRSLKPGIYLVRVARANGTVTTHKIIHE